MCPISCIIRLCGLNPVAGYPSMTIVGFFSAQLGRLPTLYLLKYPAAQLDAWHVVVVTGGTPVFSPTSMQTPVKKEYMRGMDFRLSHIFHAAQ